MNIYEEVQDINKKEKIASMILDDLEEWFGIEESKEEYIQNARMYPMWVCTCHGEYVGFVSLKQHALHSAEVYVMGVKKANHRQHIGSHLLDACVRYCNEHAISFLQVKTVNEQDPTQAYYKTRTFYEAYGFVALEVFPTLWDAWNLCLQLIMHIKKNPS